MVGFASDFGGWSGGYLSLVPQKLSALESISPLSHGHLDLLTLFQVEYCFYPRLDGHFITPGFLLDWVREDFRFVSAAEKVKNKSQTIWL